MNTREDEKWQSLLAYCAPTFAGEAEPPYGFMTRTLARLRTEKGQQAEFERIGWRALLASLAALAIAATVSLSVNFQDKSGEFEPGVRSIIQMENFQVS